MKNKFPTKSGWYWVKIEEDYIVPCYFTYEKDSDSDPYFLPGGLGDDSSNGLYEDEFEDFYKKEIIQPKF